MKEAADHSQMEQQLWKEMQEKETEGGFPLWSCVRLCLRGVPWRQGRVLLCKERRLQGLLPGHLGVQWDRYLSVRQFLRPQWATFMASCAQKCELPQHIHLLGTAHRTVWEKSNNQGNSCLIPYHLVSHGFDFCPGNSNLILITF